MAIDNNYLNDVLQEWDESYFSGLEEKILAMNGDEDAINEVYQKVHSIKGGCGFIGMTQTRDLLQRSEDVLNDLRDEIIDNADEVIDLLLKIQDFVQKALALTSESGEESVDNEVLQQLEEMFEIFE